MVQPTQTDPQFKLRYPADLKARIEKSAKSNNRSMNAEIVAALEETYSAQLTIGDMMKVAASAYHMIKRLIPTNEISEKQFHKTTEPIILYFTALGIKNVRTKLEELTPPIKDGDWITVDHVTELLETIRHINTGAK